MRGVGTLFAGMLVLVGLVALAVYIVHVSRVVTQTIHEQQQLYERARFIAEHANISGNVISLPEPADLIIIDPSGVPHVANNVTQLELPWPAESVKIYVAKRGNLRVGAADPVASSIAAAAGVAAAPVVGANATVLIVNNGTSNAEECLVDSGIVSSKSLTVYAASVPGYAVYSATSGTLSILPLPEQRWVIVWRQGRLYYALHVFEQPFKGYCGILVSLYDNPFTLSMGYSVLGYIGYRAWPTNWTALSCGDCIDSMCIDVDGATLDLGNVSVWLGKTAIDVSAGVSYFVLTKLQYANMTTKTRVIDHFAAHTVKIYSLDNTVSEEHGSFSVAYFTISETISEPEDVNTIVRDYTGLHLGSCGYGELVRYLIPYRSGIYSLVYAVIEDPYQSQQVVGG